MSTISAGTTTTTALVQTGDTTGALVLQTGSTPTTALTLSSAQNATFANTVNLPNTFGFKNRIINGAMVIDQRNAGASVTPTDASYSLDRWKCSLSQASKYTVQQSSTAPTGFVNSLKVTSSSAYSVGAGDYFMISQPIEGYNVADLNWGTANAKTITISFWVYSSLTGTFGGAINNSAQNRSYPFTYTISSANTWEQKTVTIAGDTSGTWLTTNGNGLWVFWGLGVGTTYSGTAGSWSGSTYLSATGATSVVGTSGATFYITGVQLEVGSQATSFDFRDYGRELILCQRYYNSLITGSIGWNINSTTSDFFFAFPIMRTAPSATYVSGSGYVNYGPGGQQTTSSITFYAGYTTGYVGGSNIPSGLTTNAGSRMGMTVNLSAEL